MSEGVERRVSGRAGDMQDAAPEPATETPSFAQFSIEHAAVPTLWMDSEARLVYANEAACRALGYTREELLHLRVHDIDPDFPAAAWPEKWKRLGDLGSSVAESHHRTKDGRVFPVEVAAHFVRIGGGEYACAFARDVSERQEAEKEMAKTQALLSAAIEQSPAGVLIADAPDVRIRLANSAALEMLGQTPADLTDVAFDRMPSSWRAFHPDGTPFRPEDLPLSQAVLEGKTSKNVPGIIRRPDGEERWVLANAAPVRDGSGAIIAGIVVFPDITEYRRVEEAVRASEEKYRTLSENVPVGVFRSIADERGGLVSFNPAFQRMFGHSAEELEGLPLTALYQDPADRAVLLRRLRQDGHVRDHEVRFRRRDGSIFWGAVSAQAVRGTTGGLRYLDGIVTDITEAKRAASELSASLAKLEKIIEGTIHAMASMVEMKDPYTSGHQRRVADLAAAIAWEMGLSEPRITAVRLAGAIHDLGKVVIPGEILSKPGPLSTIEMEMVRTHPQAGSDILRSVEFPWPIADIVLQHHERMDGSGYPQGLRGEALLLEARIIVVADNLEAMASHRPYRPAHTVESSLKALQDGRGTIFDPEVVDACLRLLNEGKFDLGEAPGAVSRT